MKELPVESIPSQEPSNVSEQRMDAQVLQQWQAPEFLKYERGKVWYIVMGTLSALLIMYAIWTNAVTMAIAFIVLVGVYYISHHKDPKIIDVQLTSFGIHVGKKVIPYNQVKAFWVIHHPPHINYLKLLTSDSFMSEITIQLGTKSPGSIRTTLIKHVPEYEGRGESMVDILIRATRL